ncbi:hypothetical protein [Luteibacter aegosomatissinici]|uniref:hypothetical protein n=1 Tax=Luteibacter aegosomatissinici TaxID=2911539 RepID=UPI001FF8B7D5|nr:hypothetical protein [Luteibacter aegosomatissinici]UPG95440.1 hypothetical protein L2Y97_04835 [Luteibacter aegosomatissinici]
MSYVGRMHLRMFMPGLLALGTGAVAAAALRAAEALPGELGNFLLYSHLPRWLLAAGVCAGVAIVGIQALRIRLWERGALASCYVCGCLLAPARTGRGGLGRVRPCLGCGKVHGVNHHVTGRVVPLQVAVPDSTGPGVRGAR